jgi:hypothetical protein
MTTLRYLVPQLQQTSGAEGPDFIIKLLALYTSMVCRRRAESWLADMGHFSPKCLEFICLINSLSFQV